MDLDKGTISFYRNGERLGVAFKDIRKGTAYFPAISLSFGESCLFNFGRRPFEYPIPGFSPIDGPPPLRFSPLNNISVSHQALDYMTSRLRTLLSMEQKQGQNITWPPEDILTTAAIIFEYLAPVLQNEYFIASAWYPLLVKYMEEEQPDVIDTIVKWMKLFMEDFEWEACIRSLLWYAGYKCRTASIVHYKAGFISHLKLAIQLLRSPDILRFALSMDNFYTILENFVTLKNPTKIDLNEVLPQVWISGIVGGNAKLFSNMTYTTDMHNIQSTIKLYEDLVYDLVLLIRDARILPFVFCSLLFRHSFVLALRSHSHFRRVFDFQRRTINRHITPNGVLF